MKKSLSSEETSDSSTEEHAEDSDDIVELAQQLDSNLEMDDIDKWMTADSDDVGHHLLSDEDIVGEGMNTNEVEAEEEHVVDKEDEVNGIPTPGPPMN